MADVENWVGLVCGRTLYGTSNRQLHVSHLYVQCPGYKYYETEIFKNAFCDLKSYEECLSVLEIKIRVRATIVKEHHHPHHNSANKTSISGFQLKWANLRLFTPHSSAFKGKTK